MMMPSNHFIFCLILIFLGCTDRGDHQPSVVIPDDVMTDIVQDMFILQSAFNESVGTVKDSMDEVYIQQIENQYGYSMEVIQENLHSLTFQYARLDSIYQAVIDRLDSLKQEGF